MPTTLFHPTLRRWFEDRFGEPTDAQRRGWPRIREGHNTLIAAPTGSGKTLAAFLNAIDSLLRSGSELPDETRVLYISPLKALGNDVQKNLQAPLEELAALDPELPEIRVVVRSGDTPPSVRTAMTKRPPHILVTTPESLYILLTSDGGRGMLRTVRSVIVDEIHAVAGSKRGSHLALSLERLEALVDSPLQRIGLSATQKPIEAVARFLVGRGRDCETVDIGHLRQLDLGLELPSSPLTPVCSHETWEEIYERMSQLIGEHRTTLIFVNTRKMAERVTRQLSKILDDDEVACHHGSLSKERRLDAEQRLKAGELKALVATASLELGIDIGDIDLVIQCGSTRSIATFLQRVGRAGHGLDRVPKGRLFPLTRDELVEAVALLRAVDRGELDRTPQPGKPLDILAQQMVAACVPEAWDEDELFERVSSATPYSPLDREEFDSLLQLHSDGRLGLLHRDGVNGRVRATRRARMVAITGGGAIPDNADYRVLEEPQGTFVGSVNEDFAIESSVGDVFQLGNASWQILKVEQGVMRVADAHGAPPSLPFWFGEAPARTPELSAELAALRAELAPRAPSDGTESQGGGFGASVIEGGDALHALLGSADTQQETGFPTSIPEEATRQIREYIAEGVAVLGTVPTQRRVVLERFFDESGGMQLVLHAPFGGRINRAWGLALRKRFCRGFGFELQAAADEEAMVFSLGPQHSFPLAEVFDYLHPDSARDVLIQALLPTPMFEVRWRWNATRSLMIPRMQGGKRVPPPLLRMRADDLLVKSFPEVVACGETLPPGDLPVPMDDPLVRQTVEDCLTEAMDVDGFLQVLRDIRSGEVETVAIDTPEPSAFARGILNAAPYAFLDDAPLEERRTQAVITRRVLDQRQADEIGALDSAAVERVKQEAWPDPRDAEEVHEALMWMGYVKAEEVPGWLPWLEELQHDGRVVREGDRWFAAEATRDTKEMLRGRMEALGPVFSDEPGLLALENEGAVLRVRLQGQEAWCNRRLLARIHRYTLDRLRKEIEPVSAAVYLDFLRCWQHLDEEHRLDGPRGVARVLEQLAGFEAPAVAWENSILPSRVRDYRQEHLDQLTLGGEIMWGRLWGSGKSAPRSTPIAMFSREASPLWLSLAGSALGSGGELSGGELSGYSRPLLELLEDRGAMFYQDLMNETRLLPEHLDRGLAELVALGLASCDSWFGLRQLFVAHHKRRRRVQPRGRWSPLRPAGDDGTLPLRRYNEDQVEAVAEQLLDRYGVVFRKAIHRERIPIPWRELLRALRRFELRGDVRGGRFVARFAGEQFALPDAVEMLRKRRRDSKPFDGILTAADPANLEGILTPSDPPASEGTREIVGGDFAPGDAAPGDSAAGA